MIMAKSIKGTEKKLWKEIESLLHPKFGFIMAGYPRFLGLFGRDSLIASWQLLELRPEIARKTLETLAFYQGKEINYKTGEEPGKIIHEYYPKETPDDWWKKYKAHIKWLKRGEPVYFSVDSTPLFLILLKKYFDLKKDKNFLKKTWPNAKSAINWMINFGGLDKGFLTHEKRNPEEGLMSQSWKDGWGGPIEKMASPISVVEVQGYAYLALLSAAELAKTMKEPFLEKDLEQRAKRLKKFFNEKFWLNSGKFFVVAVDGKSQQQKIITSNPGQLLFTGICEPKKIKAVVKRIFKKDLWTSFGIRTHSAHELDFDPFSYQRGTIWPHDNWIIAQGLKENGFKKEYKKIKTAILASYKKLDYLPELYGVIDNKIIKIEKACYPQAWASGALLNFFARPKL
jgi:glycogen debranching enzyme